MTPAKRKAVAQVAAMKFNPKKQLDTTQVTDKRHKREFRTTYAGQQTMNLTPDVRWDEPGTRLKSNKRK